MDLPTNSSQSHILYSEVNISDVCLIPLQKTIER